MRLDAAAEHLTVRRAGVDDLDTVVSILDEAAAWLAARGVRQWPAHFQYDWVMPALAAGQTWLIDGDAATVTVDHDDPLWADRPASADYVHRLAVRRASAGLGARVLDWCERRARDRGADLLRLDCVAANPHLRAYYERRGFRPVDTAVVGGAPGQREACGVRTVVARFEKPMRS